MILAVTHEPVDWLFVGLTAVLLWGTAARVWMRRPPDPWDQAVKVERARTHGRKVRARRRRRAAAVRRLVRRH